MSTSRHAILFAPSRIGVGKSRRSIQRVERHSIGNQAEGYEVGIPQAFQCLMLIPTHET